MAKAQIIWIEDNNAAAAETAACLFSEGEVFVYPTDTIYGIGGDPFNRQVTETISAIKSREESKKYIVLANGVEMIDPYVTYTLPFHRKFLSNLWPDCVTVVLNLNQDSTKLFGTSSLAVRMPRSRFCLDVMKLTGKMLLSTSVNRSGNPPLNTSDSIIAEFGEEVTAVFVSENSGRGKASTLISLTGEEPVLLREGSVTFEEIFAKFVSVKNNFLQGS